jgi:hypothetical protein
LHTRLLKIQLLLACAGAATTAHAFVHVALAR